MFKIDLLLFSGLVCLAAHAAWGRQMENTVSPPLDDSSQDKNGSVPSRAQMEAALNTGVTDAVAEMDAALALDKSAFDAGIDRVVPAVTDLVGPHLLTTPAALAIEKPGQALLQVAKSAISRLKIKDPSAFLGEGIPLSGIDIFRGPFLFCPYSPPTCPSGVNYRTADGSCNNLLNPLWGRSQTPFERYLMPAYDDVISHPRTQSVLGGVLPNVRKISRNFHTNLLIFQPNMNHMTMQYGQFLSHDIAFNALSQGYRGSNLDCCGSRDRHTCFPIDIPPGDPYFPPNRTCMNFVRSLPTPNLACTFGARQQLNQNTHFIDGSLIYGSDQSTADSLRTFVGGNLTTNNDLLPSDPSGAGCTVSDPGRPCFLAGDSRVNVQPALAALQTVFVREHNRLATALAALQPAWTDETLYQEARKIVIAIIQHVTFNEYLPEILGAATMNLYGLKPLASGYFGGYSASEMPMIRNGFMAAAFRFGHSMIYKFMQAHNGAIFTSNKLLKAEFLRPDLVYSHGVGQICRGLTIAPSEKADKELTEQVTRHLFEQSPGFGGDLAAINIQRARDHGIPGYQAWRRFCGLRGQFSHAANVQAQLLLIYSDPEDIDLFTGGVSETPLAGGMLGPTFACIIGQQFRSLKKGDRFYYENSGVVGFTVQQLNQIRTQTLAKVICRNTDITKIQPKALRKTATSNPLLNCTNIQNFDLSPWNPCKPVNGGWSAWKKTPCFGNIRFTYRICNNPKPNACGVPCPAPFEFFLECCIPRFDFELALPDGAEVQRKVSDAASTCVLSPALDTNFKAAILAQAQGDASRVDDATIEQAFAQIQKDASRVAA